MSEWTLELLLEAKKELRRAAKQTDPAYQDILTTGYQEILTVMFLLKNNVNLR